MVSGEKKLKSNFPDHFWCFPDQPENNSKIVTYREADGRSAYLMPLTGYERGRPRDTKGDFQTRQCARSGVSEAAGGLLCVLSQTLMYMRVLIFLFKIRSEAAGGAFNLTLLTAYNRHRHTIVAPSPSRRRSTPAPAPRGLAAVQPRAFHAVR